MTQQYTPAQLEAWAGLGPWRWQETRTNFETETALVHEDAGIVLNASWRPSSCEIQVSDPDSEALIAAAPDLARLVLEKDKEIARLKGLAWIAYHEFNAINARSGGPLDQYGMVTVTHEYWQAITDLFAKAAGETTPWPTENAKAIFEEINRQAMKETSDE